MRLAAVDPRLGSGEARASGYRVGEVVAGLRGCVALDFLLGDSIRVLVALVVVERKVVIRVCTAIPCRSGSKGLGRRPRLGARARQDERDLGRVVVRLAAVDPRLGAR